MSQNDEKKYCKTCKWYVGLYCKLEPKSRYKTPEDFCSHWTPKLLNEG